MDKASAALLILTISFSSCGNAAQRDKSPGPESKFATKTVYEHRIPESNSLPWTLSNIPDNLRPILIDATLRHGTRFPSEKRAVKWRTIVPKFKLLINSSSNFTDAVKYEISKCVDQFPKSSYYLLSSLGWKEHVSLGFKYYSMMPQLFAEVLNRNGVSDDDDLLVLSSSKVRAKASARAFLSALGNAKDDFNNLDHPIVRYEGWKVTNESNEINEQNVVQYGNLSVLVNDRLLRFFDHCEKYSQSVDKNDTADFEFENFFKSREIKNVLHRFGEIERSKDIYYVHQLCAFEKAVFNYSIWCSIFEDADLDVFEYAADLKHYYITGHGYDINVQQSCHLLQHIFNRFDQKPGNRFRATLRFGHAETLIPLVNLLGFYEENDGPLRSDSYAQKVGRIFRTGKISPFSGNLAIVVYESKSDSDKQYISFVLNEQIVKPFGLDCYFCEFFNGSIAYQKLKEKLEGCDTICKVDDRQRDEL